MQISPKYFAIHRPVEYCVPDRASRTLGKGRTYNISRRHLVFETKHELSVGAEIECAVQLGRVIHGGPDINLHVQGITVSVQYGLVEVEIKKYRLRPQDSADGLESCELDGLAVCPAG